MSATGRRGFAATAPTAADPRLRGRTYAIPFEDVWQAALRLAAGGLPRWSLRSHDDGAGVIHAQARGLTGVIHGIVIRIVLDDDAQTRVDAEAVAEGSRDLGAARRRLIRFFTALDRAVSRPSTRTPLRSPATPASARTASQADTPPKQPARPEPVRRA